MGGKARKFKMFGATKFHFQKYKKNFQSGFFFFFSSSESYFQKYKQFLRVSFSWNIGKFRSLKYKEFFNLGGRKFHSLKYKKFFLGGIFFFVAVLSFGLKIHQVAPYYTTTTTLFKLRKRLILLKYNIALKIGKYRI